MKISLLSLAFIAVLVLGVLHQVGTHFFLYWYVVWFDSLMHFLGGLAIGLCFIWLGTKFGAPKGVMVRTIVCVMLVGIGWEIFEYAYDIANPIGGNYTVDTFHDLLSDFLGAVVAGLIGGRNLQSY